MRRNSINTIFCALPDKMDFVQACFLSGHRWFLRVLLSFSQQLSVIYTSIDHAMCVHEYLRRFTRT